MQTEQAKRSYKRRNYLINKRYQLGWVSGLLCVALGAMLLTALGSAYYFVFIGGAGPTVIQEYPGSRYLSYLGIWFALSAIVLIIAGVLLTHRTAGPMYRMRKVLEQLGTGDFSVRMRLRSKDHWHEVADAFNIAVEAQEARTKMMREKLEEIETFIKNLSITYPDNENVKLIVKIVTELKGS